MNGKCHSSLPVIFLIGPTASGKTGLALALAQRLEVEIISVDSALIYRGMNIGTAKPNADEMAQVSHHLIDILNPIESYSAAAFYADARRIIAEIHARGRIPLLVGGTMLYVKALLEGLSDLPSADATLRAELLQKAAQDGWPAMHAWLARLDPQSAQRLSPHDPQRIQRALEVCLLTGKPMSWHWEHSVQQGLSCPYQLLALTLERTELHQRIAARFHAMVNAGFVEEVEQLQRMWPTLTSEHTAMRCVGYRQAWSYLSGEVDKNTFVEQGIIATRQLAKRQMTWLRRLVSEDEVLDAQLPLPALSTEVLRRIEDSVSVW